MAKETRRKWNENGKKKKRRRELKLRECGEIVERENIVSGERKWKENTERM